MKIKLTVALVSCVLGASVAHAGELKVANSDLTLAGGIGAAGIYSNNTGSNNNTDPAVTDFLLELSAPAKKGIGFTAGFGNLLMPTLLTNVGKAPVTSDLQYGWVTVAPVEGVTIEAGKLATKIGYEVAYSLANPHIMMGALWNSQPVYYGGARASYALGETTLFAEANEESLPGAGNAYVVGASGAAAGINYSAVYSNAKNDHDILDLIVSTELAGMAVAANLDVHKFGNAAPGMDDKGVGIALHAVPKFGAVSVPVRLEYLDDGTSGAFGGMGKGSSYTVTPTYHFADNTFVRAELAYVTADNEIFSNSKGASTDSKTTFAVQVGYKF